MGVRHYVYCAPRDPEMSDDQHRHFCELAEDWLTEHEGEELSIGVSPGPACMYGRLIPGELYELLHADDSEAARLQVLGYSIPKPEHVESLLLRALSQAVASMDGVLVDRGEPAHRGYILRPQRDPKHSDEEHERFCKEAQDWLTLNEGAHLSIALASEGALWLGDLAEERLYEVKPSGPVTVMAVFAELNLAWVEPAANDATTFNVLSLIRRARTQTSARWLADREGE